METMSVSQFINALPEERRAPVKKLRQVIADNLPDGFKESVGGNFINYVVPHSLFPDGYHCNPEQPLPFISIASQKNFIAIYHMGLYADPVMLQWFTTEYPKHSKTNLDMGKSCIRFKKPDQIPYELIAELAKKMTPKQWIKLYQDNLRK